MIASPIPLPFGWTQHLSPDGVPYYHHAGLGQSTYVRPGPIPLGGPAPQANHVQPMYTGPPPDTGGLPPRIYSGPPPTLDSTRSTVSQTKKDRPKHKDAIPGADGWLRVTTTLGRVFYTHKETKRSEWSIPEEIRDQVSAMTELEQEVRQSEQTAENSSVQLESKRRRESGELHEGETPTKKLKAVSDEPEEVALHELSTVPSLPRDSDAATQDVGAVKPSGENDAVQAQEEDDDDEAAWQRDLAAEMLADASAAADRSTSQLARGAGVTSALNNAQIDFSQPPPGYPHHPPSIHAPSLAQPSVPSLSLEEASALFRRMLTSLNGTPDEVNPMAPWDMELPKFVHRSEYSSIQSSRDRQDAFNEWCKLRLREKRALRDDAKPIQSGSTEKDGQKQSSSSTEEAKQTYLKLLSTQVKSTRTTWTEFRTAWKKDRRFYRYGRDDKQRETEFRAHVKRLGEEKRAAALQAESAFLELLSSKLPHQLRVDQDSERNAAAWRDAKRTPGLDSDPRYDAVGSATRRAELFTQWRRQDAPSTGSVSMLHSASKNVDVKAVKGQTTAEERALREREEKVRAESKRQSGRNHAALRVANHEDSTISFNQLLIDQVRDPLASYHSLVRSLDQDERSREAKLTESERRRLFDQHVDGLLAKRIKSLQSVFQKHAPTLDVSSEVALPLIRDDPEVERLHLDQMTENTSVRAEFERWNRERWQHCQRDFQEMLKENAFVDFWGRLRKEAAVSDANEDAAPAAEQEDDDDEAPSLIRMAASIDLSELHSVLRTDARYRAFKHVPEERERWIRSYLEQMAKRKQTVHERD